MRERNCRSISYFCGSSHSTSSNRSTAVLISAFLDASEVNRLIVSQFDPPVLEIVNQIKRIRQDSMLHRARHRSNSRSTCIATPSATIDTGMSGRGTTRRRRRRRGFCSVGCARLGQTVIRTTGRLARPARAQVIPRSIDPLPSPALLLRIRHARSSNYLLTDLSPNSFPNYSFKDQFQGRVDFCMGDRGFLRRNRWLRFTLVDAPSLGHVATRRSPVRFTPIVCRYISPKLVEPRRVGFGGDVVPNG